MHRCSSEKAGVQTLKFFIVYIMVSLDRCSSEKTGVLQLKFFSVYTTVVLYRYSSEKTGILKLNTKHVASIRKNKNSFQCKQISSPEMLSSNRLWNRPTILITLLSSLPLLPLSCEFLQLNTSPFLSFVPKCERGNRNVLNC